MAKILGIYTLTFLTLLESHQNLMGLIYFKFPIFIDTQVGVDKTAGAARSEQTLNLKIFREKMVRKSVFLEGKI